MKCAHCGSESYVTARTVVPETHGVVFSRVCDRGHKFTTVEVYPSQLADAREMSCAVRNITRRIYRFQRDMAIAQDPRPVKDVAEEFNLTDARVRQIRASMQPFLKAAPRSKIASHNSERK